MMGGRYAQVTVDGETTRVSFKRRGSDPQATLARFWSRVDARGPHECWPWTGGTRNGYGRIYITGSDGKPRGHRAHRVAYRLHHQRPIEQDLHHICGNTLCCNPSHLTEVRNAEHRTLHIQTRCAKGHDDWEGNGDKRRCRSCRYEKRALWRAERKARGLNRQ